MILKHKKHTAFIFTLLFALLFVGCNDTAYVDSSNIIEASALSEILKDENTIIIDARDSETYSKGHLKGSINLTAAELVINEPIKAMLAPKEQIEKVLRSKGISNDSKIYVYDNSGGVHASRIWWTLKSYGHENIKVINNGEKAILENNLELSLDVPNLPKSNYTATQVNTSLIASFSDVEKAISDDSVKIIDVRSRSEFDEGSIASALLYPHKNNLYTDGSFKAAKTVYLNYKDLGLSKDDSIILYCKSSFRATQTALLLTEAGYSNVKVYDGAWLEWSTKDMPKEEKKNSVPVNSQDAS